MKKLLLLLVAACALALVGIASAQDGADKVTLTSSAPGIGTAKKPKPIAPSWSVDIAGAAEGDRSASPLEHDWKWNGITENGKYFETCTAQEIDAAQSDAGCDPKSVVARGSLTAFLGPEGQRSQNVECAKQITIYNGGAGKASLYAFGDPAACAGVGYLPPIPITWKKQGKHTSLQVFVFPDNIVHPLPGLEGAFTHLEYNFVKRTTTVGKGKKKHKVGYLMSYGCNGASKRTFTFTSKTAAAPPATFTADAGAC